MIGNLSERNFIIYNEVVNLRKNFSGLFALVNQNNMAVDFFNNSAIVFINRRRNMFKCLYWENGSLAIWNKQLTKGTFSMISPSEEVLSFSDFILFIHGYIPPENRK